MDGKRWCDDGLRAKAEREEVREIMAALKMEKSAGMCMALLLDGKPDATALRLMNLSLPS